MKKTMISKLTAFICSTVVMIGQVAYGNAVNNHTEAADIASSVAISEAEIC